MYAYIARLAYLNRFRYTFAFKIQAYKQENMDLNVSVIIPCYNEKETIYQILEAVEAGGCASEIIVVEDGSSDGTREMLKEMAPNPLIKIIYHDHNQGKGAAVRTGFSAAKGDVFIIQDADLEYDPREYPVLLKPIEEGRSQVVYGSRFLGGPR